MLGKVQSEAFVFLVHAQTDDGIHQLQDNKRGDGRERHRERHADELVPKLMRAARQRNRHAVLLKVVAISGFTSALARKPSINMPVVLPTP